MLAAGVLGAIGLGALAASYQHNEQRRQQFVDRLRRELEEHDLHLLSATFGRAAGNVPVWSVTVRTPYDGVRGFEVKLPSDSEPYGEDGPALLASRVAAAAA